MTGLEPSEHGWLGWDMFFKDDNETVSVYRNIIKDTDISAKHKVKERPEMQYETIIDKINKETSNDAYVVWAFDKDYPCDTLEKICDRIVKLCNKPNKKFIYAYYHNPDKVLHEEGFESSIVKNEMQKIDNITQELFYKLPKDTLIVVTADHGHIECNCKILHKNQELFNMLARNTGIEARACALTLKPNIDRKKFEQLFYNLYGNDFKLYSKEEVKKEMLFGKKMKHILLEDNIGDYLAVATKDSCLLYDENGKVFKTYHAGITRDEMEIPLIVLKK